MSKSTMRKMAPALALTGSAVALVALFDPGVHALAGGNDTEMAAAPKKATGTDNTTSNDSAKKSSRSQSTPKSASKPSASAEEAAPTPTAEAPSSEAASCDSAEAVDGPVVNTRWGPVQVSAAVAGGKVCSADALQYPDGDGRSAQISSYAIPILNEQAVKHNGEISGVSGASYTSYGYYQSLQAILDKAK